MPACLLLIIMPTVFGFCMGITVYLSVLAISTGDGNYFLLAIIVCLLCMVVETALMKMENTNDN